MKKRMYTLLSLSLLTFTGSFANSSVNDPVFSDTLKIVASSLPSGITTPFIICDTTHIRIIRNRMQQIITMFSELSTSTNISSPSVMGYRGLGLYSTKVMDMSICNAYKGYMSVVTSMVSSRIDNLTDYNSETERLIAKIGVSENLSTMVNGEQVMFSSLIPDNFKKNETRYGLLVLELLTDTFDIDFSMLESRYSYTPPQKKQPIFSDLKMTSALELSSTRYGFRLNAPEGVAAISNAPSLTGTFSSSLSSIDSMVKTSIPVLDSLTNNYDSIHFTGSSIFSPDVHKQSFLIKTTDLGLVYLQPVAWYVGAIDRIAFLWIYSSDTLFDMAALKKFAGQVSTVKKISFTKRQGAVRPIMKSDLSGRIVSEGALKTAILKPGCYLNVGKKSGRSIIVDR